MIKKPTIKKFKRAKKVKSLVQENIVTPVVERASDLNPLTPPTPEEPINLRDVPKITDENITEHREEVLKGARKYIYPLQHSKHRIVIITLGITAATIVGFSIYCSLALYKYYQYNTFVYRITQVVPFPIARAGGSFVDYENYLFEIRHFTHYYQTQQPQNNSGNASQIQQFRKQALNDVINNAYVKKLAGNYSISVSDKEVDARIAIVRNQNRLGGNNKVFTDVLRDYWGWSIADFKRSLKEQILAEKVIARLDTDTAKRAQSVLAQINSGADFTALAKEVSDDATSKPNGGDYGTPVSKDNPNLPPQVVDQLFKLQAGQVSGIIETGLTLEIVKVNQNSGATVNAQHISFKLQDINVYIDQLKAKEPTRSFVHF